MDSTQLLNLVGGFGVFQKLIFILCSIIQMFVGIHMLANVFLMGEPKHRCYIPGCDNISSQYYENFIHFAIPNITDEYGKVISNPCNYHKQYGYQNKCEENAFDKSSLISCKSYIWDTAEFESTTISEFKIICDKSWNEAYSSSFFMTGVLVGSAGFGIISDRYGRKSVIMLASVIFLLSSIATAFSINFTMFSCLRFITAACVCGLVQAGYILALEFIDTSKRLLCSSLIQISFSIGQLILGLVAYNIRSWRMLELSISVPGVILLLYYWILPESVRWLASNGNHVKAKKIIMMAAKWNKIVIPEDLLVSDKFVNINSSIQQTKLGPVSLMKNSHLRKWSAFLVVNWLVITMVYYGLALSAGHLYGDVYMNFSILAAVEIPSVLLATVALVHFGSRRVLCSMMILSGLACGATNFIPSDVSWVSTFLGIIGRSTISASFAIVYVYSAEIFPTVVRQTGIGLSSTFGRIGSIIAPIIIQLGKIYSFLPMLIFSIASIFSGILTLALPETLNKQLPDTIEDLENFAISEELLNKKCMKNQANLFPHYQNTSDEERRLLNEEY